MNRSAIFKGYSTCLIVHALIVCPTFAHAQSTGPGSNADVDVCSQTVMELDQAKWRQQAFSFGDSPAFPDIAATLNVAHDHLPELYKAFQKTLTKSWSYGFGSNQFRNDGFSDCKPEDTYSYDIAKRTTVKAACQTPDRLDDQGNITQKGEVIINPVLFKKLNVQACKQIKDTKQRNEAVRQFEKSLIFRELLLGMTMGKDPTKFDTSAVLSALMDSTSDKPIAAQDLQEILKKSGFGSFPLVDSNGVAVSCDPVSDSTPSVAPAVSEVVMVVSQKMTRPEDRILAQNMKKGTTFKLLQGLYGTDYPVFQNGRVYSTERGISKGVICSLNNNLLRPGKSYPTHPHGGFVGNDHERTSTEVSFWIEGESLSILSCRRIPNLGALTAGEVEDALKGIFEIKVK